MRIYKHLFGIALEFVGAKHMYNSILEPRNIGTCRGLLQVMGNDQHCGYEANLFFASIMIRQTRLARYLKIQIYIWVVYKVLGITLFDYLLSGFLILEFETILSLIADLSKHSLDLFIDVPEMPRDAKFNLRAIP